MVSSSQLRAPVGVDQRARCKVLRPHYSLSAIRFEFCEIVPTDVPILHLQNARVRPGPVSTKFRLPNNRLEGGTAGKSARTESDND